MNTMKKSIFALILIAIAITGCKKDTEKTNNQQTSEGIKLKNGYLVFKDSATFNEHLDWIEQNRFTPEAIENFNDNIDFKSFRQIYNYGTSISSMGDFDNYKSKYPECFKKIVLEDNTIFWEMPIEFTSSFYVNHNCIYQIGETIYRTTPDYFFSTKNQGKVTDLSNTSRALLDDEIQKIANVGKYVKAGEYSYRTAYFPGWSDRRIVVRLFEYIKLGKVTFENRTTSQQRHWSGVWVKAKIDEIRHFNYQGQYVVNQNGYSWPPVTVPTQNLPVYSDELSVEVVRADGPVDFSVSSVICNNSGTRYGVVASVNNNEMFPY